MIVYLNVDYLVKDRKTVKRVTKGTVTYGFHKAILTLGLQKQNYILIFENCSSKGSLAKAVFQKIYKFGSFKCLLNFWLSWTL